MIFVDLPAELFKGGSRRSWSVMFCLLNFLTLLKFLNETNWTNIKVVFMALYCHYLLNKVQYYWESLEQYI